jgi:hypothetical protein
VTKPALIPIEGPRGDQRGVNGSQSKFLTENLAYVPKSTLTLSL